MIRKSVFYTVYFLTGVSKKSDTLIQSWRKLEATLGKYKQKWDLADIPLSLFTVMLVCHSMQHNLLF
jgi:hypothetical protein